MLEATGSKGTVVTKSTSGKVASLKKAELPKNRAGISGRYRRRTEYRKLALFTSTGAS